jgi:hypothetical protein
LKEKNKIKEIKGESKKVKVFKIIQIKNAFENCPCLEAKNTREK